MSMASLCLIHQITKSTAPQWTLIDTRRYRHWQNEADGLKNDQDALNEFYRQFPRTDRTRI